MERSEPSLVPEWLRSNGGCTDGGSSSHHFASSQADAPVLALPKRSRSSKNISNSDASHSSLLERSSSSNSRRSSSSNGFPKHDKNSSARSYYSFTRSQRDRDRERLTITDNWDSEYSDSLKGGMIIGKAEGTLRRSQSMVSKRQGEVPQRRFSTDLRNGSHSNHENENSSHSVGSSVTGIPKVSLERDFPVLGSEERPKTPDVIRVSSPGLSRGIQSLSIGNPPSVGSEGWTSALVEVPPGAGSNSGGSSPAMQPSAVAPSGSNSASGAGSTSSGLNMAEALAQAPAQSHNIPQPSVQMQRDELAIAQSKKLIPMTPKALGVTPSDKLKPKTPVRSSESAVALKKGMQHPSPLQLGSQAIRGTSVRVDSPKSPSSGKLLLLKPGRENGASSVLKDVQSPTTNVSNKVPNGQSSGSPSVASVPLKNPHNPKVSPVERKTSTFGMNPVPVVDKRPSFSQAQSRSNFFKLMREKSMNNTSGTAVSTDMVDKSDKELKEVTSVQVTPVETGSELKCNGEISTMAESFAHTREIDNAAVYPDDEEEIAFLISLGWDDKAGDDEGLTEEEINTFWQEVMKRKTSPRVCRLLQKLESFFD